MSTMDLTAIRNGLHGRTIVAVDVVISLIDYAESLEQSLAAANQRATDLEIELTEAKQYAWE